MELTICIISDAIILLMVIYSIRVMVRFAKEKMIKEGKAVDNGRLLATGFKPSWDFRRGLEMTVKSYVEALKAGK